MDIRIYNYFLFKTFHLQHYIQHCTHVICIVLSFIFSDLQAVHSKNYTFIYFINNWYNSSNHCIIVPQTDDVSLTKAGVQYCVYTGAYTVPRILILRRSLIFFMKSFLRCPYCQEDSIERCFLLTGTAVFYHKLDSMEMCFHEQLKQCSFSLHFE